MSTKLQNRVSDLEKVNKKKEWSFIWVISNEDGSPFQGSVWGVEGEINPFEGETLKSFYHRLKVADHLRKRPEDTSDEEFSEALGKLRAKGELRTPKRHPESQSAVHVMEFEDE